MAEKKYSQSDLAKMKADVLADLRAKGADAREAYIVHDGGEYEGIKHLKRDAASVVDQSQEQTARNRGR